MRFWGMAIVAAAVVTAGAAEAGKQTNTQFRAFGQWKVETVLDDGKFFLCRGITKTNSGIVGLLYYPNGKWAIAFPDLSLKPGSKVSGSLDIGKASQPVELVASQPGVRERVFITDDVLNALRQGGKVSLKIAGKTFDWDMTDAGQAIGAVQDCWTAGKKIGG